MLSDNPIIQTQALTDLVNHNFSAFYVVGVVILAIICWKASKWI